MTKKDDTSNNGKENAVSGEGSVSRRDLAGRAAGAVAAVAVGTSVLGSDASAAAGLSHARVLEIAQTDVNTSITVGELTKQVASSEADSWCWYWPHWCIIGPEDHIVEQELPTDLAITDDMTLAQAMVTIRGSRHSASGLHITRRGLKIAQ